MTVGHIILSERKRQNMKQAVLANKICSVSYLSKIENGVAVPSDEIKSLLYKKLNIDENSFSQLDEKRIIHELYLLLKESVIKRNRKELNQRLIDYPVDLVFQDPKIHSTYYLYLFRLYFISYKGDLDHLKKVMEVSIPAEGCLDAPLRFQYRLNMSLFYYVQEQYGLALEYAEKCLLDYRLFSIEEWQLADFYYILSLCSLKRHKTHQAYEHALEASKIFQGQFQIDRVIDCYVIMANCMKRGLKFEQAEELLDKAFSIISDHQLDHYRGLILQNLGEVSAKKGDSQKAIQYFEESIQCKKDISSICISILSIIIEYSKLKDPENVISWCQKGFDYLKDHGCPDSKYHFHFQAYLTMNQPGNPEKTIMEVVDFFEAANDYRHAHKYAVYLADYYAMNRKFKNASLYYQKANENYFNHYSIKNWEEL
ncbi:helix-turn-helix transcriptional regulator [Planococcus sp. MERTA32b]|nr:helix-turn-helix transcriptional regulator [Planococcus sp. MER TA 32b]